LSATAVWVGVSPPSKHRQKMRPGANSASNAAAAPPPAQPCRS